MPSSRDSSVLRSLAVAFGDGLAFGAGMKLSQRAATSTKLSASKPPDLGLLLDRIAELEKRVDESGPAAAARSITAGGSPFDQKVLEAVVAALDARLNEQAGRTESRIAQLEARLAIELKSLHQQDHSVQSTVETRVEELNSYFANQLAALHRQAEEDRQTQSYERLVAGFEDRFTVELQSLREGDLSLDAAVEKRVDELNSNVAIQIDALRRQVEEDRQAQSHERLVAGLEDRLTVELQSLRQDDLSLEAAVEKRIDELSSNFDIQVAALRSQADEDRHAIRTEMIAMHREFAQEVARAVERRVEDVVGRHADLLRAELDHKDDQIAELREVIFGFAQACRALTERPAPRARQELEPEPSNVQVLPDRRAV
jgi:hypothetical protein